MPALIGQGGLIFQLKRLQYRLRTGLDGGDIAQKPGRIGA